MTKTAKTRGPKEEALRAKREDKAGDIPAFLKRTETPEQADARRAKQAKAEERKRFGDSKGLTVKKPPEPIDPKIAKAIARDLKADEEAGGDAAMARAASFIKKGQAAQKAVDDILANARAKADEKLTRKAKKLSPLLARAIAVRENMTATAMRDAAKPPIKVAGPDLGDGPGLARLRKSPNAENLRKENAMAQKSATAIKSVAIAKPAKKKPAKRNGVVQIADSAVITVLAKENPKRGKGAKRFALYRSGMTFAKYVDAQKGNRSQARSDALFDMSREWIKIVPAPKSA